MQDSYVKEISETDLKTCDASESFLQSSMWGEFKSRFGWAARSFLVSFAANGRELKIPLLVLTRRLMRFFMFLLMAVHLLIAAFTYLLSDMR